MTFNDSYYPKLVGSYYGSKRITQSWRNIVRCRLREQYSLQYILEHNTGETGRETGRASILKEICHGELPECIEMRKKRRNVSRLELGKVGLRNAYPQDVINNIFTFTRFF